jgi:Zn-dependent protease with chaperone function
MKLIRFLLFLIMPVLHASAQPKPATESFPEDPGFEKTFLEGISKGLNRDLASISGSNKKYISEIYKERYEHIKMSCTEKEILTAEAPRKYLNSIAEIIFRSNPGLSREGVRIVFSRAWWPNASSMGEGTVFFNIGLFNRLSDESQAAFVLCHELAHFYLNHSNNKIAKYVQTVQSDEFQKQLKTIQRSEYRQNQQLTGLAKNLGFSTFRHSREFEHAADSMALELMKNTGYDLTGALECIGALDSVDQDKYNFPLDLEKRFDFETFHFRKSWLLSDAIVFAKETASAADLAEADSMKTHPDCIMRVRALTEKANALNKTSNKRFLVSSEDFQLLKKQFDYEVLRACFERDRVSLCLYYSLEMFQQYPDDAFLHLMIGKCLNEMYSKQKAHELGRVTDLPNNDFQENYNQLLHLIQNVRLSELAALSYHFLNQYSKADQAFPGFAAVWEKSKQNFNQ